MHQKGLQLQARLKMQEIKAISFCWTPFFDSFWLFRVAVQSTKEFIYKQFIDTVFIFQSLIGWLIPQFLTILSALQRSLQGPIQARIQA